MQPTYDAIVIGAGINGLVLAIRLQRAGLATLIVDHCAHVGGMARSEEPLLPGFRHNPHANYLAYGSVSPFEKEFDLMAAGLDTIMPEAQHGFCFEDGRPPLVLYRNDLMERSAASLAIYSRRDARTFLEIKRAANAFDPIIAASLYSPPSRRNAKAMVEGAEQAFARWGTLASVSARQIIDTLFEADEVRALFYQLAAETGLSVEAADSGVGFLSLTLWMVGQWRLPLGGMQSYANALASVARRAGVEIALNTKAEEIIVRSGSVDGIVLAGGTEVTARRATVASSAGLVATMQMLPDQTLSRSESASLQAYDAVDGPNLASVMFCLRSAPDYRSSHWNSDINRCFRTIVGYGDAQTTLMHLREVETGLLPQPSAAFRVNTLWDPSQAPEGFHVAGGDVLMPAVTALSGREWKDVSMSFIDALLPVWQRCAPNMAPANILASCFTPPQKYDRVLRIREGFDQYRTEVNGLYVCSASTHPGGGAHGACGYNAFTAITESMSIGECENVRL